MGIICKRCYGKVRDSRTEPCGTPPRTDEGEEVLTSGKVRYLGEEVSLPTSVNSLRTIAEERLNPRAKQSTHTEVTYLMVEHTVVYPVEGPGIDAQLHSLQDLFVVGQQLGEK